MILIPKTYKYIFTQGGCATWAIGRFIGENIDRPQKNNVHARSHEMREYIPPHSKILYLYSDPREAILSFKRRDFFKMPYTHCIHLNGDVNGMKTKRTGWTLKEFIDNGVDFFQLEQHFQSWYESPYNVMFVKYDHLKQSMEHILKFFDINNRKADDFHFKQRLSQISRLPTDWQNGLNQMFERYIDFLESIPPCMIKEESK